MGLPAWKTRVVSARPQPARKTALKNQSWIEFWNSIFSLKRLVRFKRWVKFVKDRTIFQLETEKLRLRIIVIILYNDQIITSPPPHFPSTFRERPLYPSAVHLNPIFWSKEKAWKKSCNSYLLSQRIAEMHSRLPRGHRWATRRTNR